MSKPGCSFAAVGAASLPAPSGQCTMSRYPCVLLAFAVLLASPAHADECSTLPRSLMHIRLTVTSSPVRDAAPVIKQIVDQVWRREGMRVEWVEGAVPPDAWNGIDAWIAAIPGLRIASATSNDSGALGEVLFTDGVPRRMIRLSIDAAIDWVRRDQAARFGTSTRVLNLTLGDTARLVPYALGYAAAHELGHFVLGSPAHAKSGVMQATFEGAHRLLQPSAPLQLDRDTRARLRERLDEAASCP
ncbi:MAG: hypothetical protein AB7Q16_25075 [Vicinamibacterales bacterium]